MKSAAAAEPDVRRSARIRLVGIAVLVVLAAMLRVGGGMLLPDAYVATVVASGICWFAAFALYAVRYWPVLSRPRLDGKPG